MSVPLAVSRDSFGVVDLLEGLLATCSSHSGNSRAALCSAMLPVTVAVGGKWRKSHELLWRTVCLGAPFWGHVPRAGLSVFTAKAAVDCIVDVAAYQLGKLRPQDE